jgi:excisionase family DNA binding protein
MIRLMTVEEIAELLKLNTAHVRDRVTHQKSFPGAIVLGNRKRWIESEVHEWILNHRSESK